MKPTELRIGNLLFDKLTGTKLRVTDIRENGFVTHVIDRSMFPLPDGWGARPIPLSYDLLISIGFVDYAKNGAGCRLHLNSTDELCYYAEENSLRYQTIGSGFSRDFNIKFFHQLQNLYFIITGLEIKESV